MRETDPDWHGDDEEESKSASAPSKNSGKSMTVPMPRATSSIAFLNPHSQHQGNGHGVLQQTGSIVHGSMHVNKPGPILQPPIPPMWPSAAPHGAHSVSAASPIWSSSVAPSMYHSSTPASSPFYARPPPTQGATAAREAPGQTMPVVESSSPLPSQFETKSFWRSTIAMASFVFKRGQSEQESDAAAKQDTGAAARSPPARPRLPPQPPAPQFTPPGVPPPPLPPARVLASPPPQQFGGSYPGYMMQPTPAALRSPPPSGVRLVPQPPAPPLPRMGSSQSLSSNVSASFLYQGGPGPLQYPIVPANNGGPPMAANFGSPPFFPPA